MSEEKYVLLKKEVGETPLQTLEEWRVTRPDLENTPMAYAGRLDPMASGQLLILIGEECKKQAEYHNLDKEYSVGVLFGASSDSGDVLGLINEGIHPVIEEAELIEVMQKLIGDVELPYPIFSSKTVQGKPLHTWAMEGRLDEIKIPTRKSRIHKLELNKITTLSRLEVAEKSLSKIELIPPVTDPRKALGNDFRRPLVRESWAQFKNSGEPSDVFYLADITCTCSSGTYMRTLAEIIAEKFNTEGLAFSIHRSLMGKFDESKDDWEFKF